MDAGSKCRIGPSGSLRRHPDDRHQVKVALTEAGKKYVKRLFPEFELLTAEEQDELARLCRKVGLRSEADAASSRN